MVPGAEYFPAERVQAPVWQLAFYAPLEETKGIKLFCDAVEQLPKSVLARPGFEVYIIGEEAKIDQKLSLPWLRERTAKWTWRTHILPSPTKWVHPFQDRHPPHVVHTMRPVAEALLEHPVWNSRTPY